MEKSSRPIPQHLNDFLDWLDVEKGLSSKSQENYARFLKRFLDWLEINKLNDLLPHRLTPEHIWKYRAYLARQYTPKTRKPLKKTTQNYYLIALRSLLNFFANRDIISLPSEKIQLAKEKDARAVSFLDLEQIEKLLAAPDISKVRGLRDRVILEILFSTGMRISELLGLNREQIKKLKPSVNELEIVIIGKGSRPRPIYFSERAIHWLRLYLQARTDKEKPLFVNYRGTVAANRLTARAVQKSIKRYAVTAGVPLTVTPHVMRHSFATDLLNQGVDLRILQEMLGHKSISATQIYAHVTNKKLREIHHQFHSGRKLKV